MGYGITGSDSGGSDSDAGTVVLEPGQESNPVTPGPSRPEEPALAPASRGRYIVIESVGAGGMGAVWRAYDPKLQREVALKQLHRERLNKESERRLIREAQAMARLNHPNVVAVYDVDVSGEEGSEAPVLIAMEYVAGRTLHRWIESESPPWPEIVAAYRKAGEGLAAAHRAGIVHRDFKPSNVLVGTESGEVTEVKVTDFGLAKEVEGIDSLPTEQSLSTSRSLHGGPESLDELSARLTQTHVVMGTPRYMAPEQHAGATAGPAADQYAYCVALWEALCGSPPFAEPKLSTLAKAKFRGPPDWPRGVSVPRPIVDALHRGLAVDPDARWPSMQHLLAAIDVDPGRRRRTAVRLAGGVLVLGSAGLALVAWQGRMAEVCTGAPALIEPAWGEERRVQVRAAVEGTGRPFAADALAAIEPRLDDYASRWSRHHHDACEATSVRHEQSEAAMDLRMACLHRARADLLAATELLARADDTVVEKALDLVDGLPVLERCDDPSTLAGVAPPPAAIAEAVEQARAELSRAGALQRTGQYEPALAIAQQVVGEAATLGYPPLDAEARYLEGDLLENLGRYSEAETALEQALRIAFVQSMPRHAARVSSALVDVVGYREARHAEGRWLGTIALSLAQAVDPGGALEASARDGVASVQVSEGKYEEAREGMEQVLRMRRELFGDDSLPVASSLHGLGINAAQRGDYEESDRLIREALELRRRILGPTHPAIGFTLNALSDTLRVRGELDEALTLGKEALEVRQRALPDNHPTIGASLNNIGLVYYMKGDYESALDYNQRALGVREAAHGPEHRDVADSENNVGACLNALGRYADAETHHRRALEIRRKALGDEHPAIAMSLTNLGLSVRHQGHLAEAEDFARQALELNVARLGAEHSEVANNHDNLGTAFYEQGKYAEALEQYSLARDIRKKTLGEGHAEIARALSNMGNPLFELGRLEQAEAVFREAIEIWERELGPEYADLGFAWNGLGGVQWARGDLDGAEDAFVRCLQVREAALGLEHPLVAVPLTRRGQLLTERGRAREAVPLLERALTIRTETDEPMPLRIESTFALGQALWAAGRDRARARTLVEQALADAERTEDEDTEEITAWLASHRG